MLYQLTDSKAKAAISMSIACISFTFMTAAMNYGCQGIPAAQLIFFRGLIDLIIVVPVILYLKIKLFGNNPKPLFFRATFGVFSAFCIFWACLHMPIANAAALFRTTPLFMPFFAYFTIKEKLYLKNFLLAAFGFAGVVLILKPQNEYAFSYAGLVPLLGAFSTAASFVTIRHLASKESQFTIMFYFFLLSVIYPLIFFAQNFIMPQPEQWLYIFIMGILGFVGQVFVTKAFSHASANVVAPWTYTEIIFSAIFGYLLLGQNLDYLTIIGIAVIFFSAISIKPPEINKPG